jgi:hypothetical protein
VDVEKSDGTLLARLDTQIPAGALRSAQVSYLDALEVGQFVGDATKDIRVSFNGMVSVFEGGRSIKDTVDVATLPGGKQAHFCGGRRHGHSPSLPTFGVTVGYLFAAKTPYGVEPTRAFPRFVGSS